MLSKEEILENTKSMSQNEYSRLVAEVHLSRAAREKCTMLEFENEELRLENERLRMVVYGTISEKENLIAKNYDTIINEADLISERNLSDNTALYDSAAAMDILKEKIRSYPPNDELDDHINYLFRGYFLDDDLNDCSKCDGKYRVISMVPKTTFKIEENKAVLLDEVFMGYKCDKCGDELENGFDVLKKSAPVIHEPVVSAEAISYMLVQKYLFSRSFKTQELYWKRHDLRLDQRTMCSWCNEACDRWLVPLYNNLKKELLKRPLICADVEGIRNYKITENDYLAEENKMFDMFVYRTPAKDKAPIVVYDLNENYRYFYEPINYEEPMDYLKNYKGVVHTEKTEKFDFPGRKFSIAAMWSRVADLFEDVLDMIPPQYHSGSTAEQCIEICREIIKNDKDSEPVDEEDVKLEIRELSNKELTDYLIEMSADFVSSGKDPEIKSTLGKAFNYILDNLDELECYYTNGQTSVDNHLCAGLYEEIKAGGCRRFIALNTHSERTTAVMSIIQTALLNNLDPQKYLTFYLKNVASSDAPDLKKLYPWSCSDSCKILIHKNSDPRDSFKRKSYKQK